ncbi:hypothetical protein EYC80_008434 [Monilinia laxa]|uniref:Uncharacterized protein n=1 Tax=Monilinia laxa TaxID=61186 RepID=A0A5N6JS03_MONLA|nr:hypothetical protein EYC80_008434 [Monilinia laxa]
MNELNIRSSLVANDSQSLPKPFPICPLLNFNSEAINCSGLYRSPINDKMSALRGYKDYAAGWFTYTVRLKGEKFISAFPLTISEGQDSQVHSDPEETYGRITIPLLVQDDTFCRESELAYLPGLHLPHRAPYL